MKTIHHTKLALGLWLLSAAPLLAQTFDSGSNGSYGPLNPTSNTNLDMPPDGIFHCTTINIPVSVRVFFNRNNLNTPVYLLAQSNVVISGYISVNGGSDSGSNPGRAGPGGFDGGFGAIQSYPASDGQGPGGGSVAGNNNAVFAFPQGANTNVYGNTLISPLTAAAAGQSSLRPARESLSTLCAVAVIAKTLTPKAAMVLDMGAAVPCGLSLQ